MNTFYDLFRLLQSYEEKLAFVNGKHNITYKNFTDDIITLSNLFKTRDSFILLNLKDKYYFSVAYFATVLSGNIACLQSVSDDVINAYSHFPFSLVLDDDLILKQLRFHEEVLNYSELGEMATVICSSGTTALPKAIALSEENIISNLKAGMARYQYVEGGRFVNILPYTHCFGMICDLLAPLCSASGIYLADNIFSFWEALPLFHPTALNLTPGLVSLLLKRLNRSSCAENIVGNSLYKIMSGGASTADSMYSEFQKYNITIYACYGLSECTCGVASNGETLYKAKSCGKPVDCNSVVIDDDNIIHIKGNNVMLGYLDCYGKYQIRTSGEWISQDIGYFDEEGYLFVTGRFDDLMVFSDGTKLMPQVIENFLEMSEMVEEAVVFQQKDAIHAKVVLKDKEYIDLLKEKVQEERFEGHSVNKVIVSETPLEKNKLGKKIRKNVR